MLKAVIFDFDGVLADSFAILYRLNATAMRQVGLALRQADYRSLFAGNIHRELRRRVGSERRRVRFARFKTDRFAARYRRVALFPSMKTLIRRASRRYRLAIVSSTASALVEDVLRRAGLTEQFAVVFGSDATSKAAALRSVMRVVNSVPQTTAFVTDTQGDVRIGNRLKLKTVAVAWGFQSEDALRDARPEALMRNHQELLRFLRC